MTTPFKSMLFTSFQNNAEYTPDVKPYVIITFNKFELTMNLLLQLSHLL